MEQEAVSSPGIKQREDVPVLQAGGGPDFGEDLALAAATHYFVPLSATRRRSSVIQLGDTTS